MTDFVLKSNGKMTMYEAYAVLGVLDADGNLIQRGMTEDGGNSGDPTRLSNNTLQQLTR